MREAARVLTNRPWRALPSGAKPVAVGLAISGASAYAFLAFASHTLTPERYGSLAALWSLTFLLWPGSFLALERETARRLTVTESSDPDDQSSLRDVFWFAAILIAVALAVILLSRPILSRLFAGDDWMIADLAVAGPSIALQFIVFGVFAGNEQFGGYSTVWAVEGIGRLGLASVFVVLGLRTAGAFGLVVAVAPLVAVLIALPRLGRCRWRSSRTDANRIAPMFWSLASNLCLSLLVNSGPALVRVLAPHEPARLTGSFLSALVIVRVPLFLYAAASGPLMPALSSSASQRNWSLFRQALNRLILLVVVLTALAVPIAAVFGSKLLRVLFGTAYSLDGASLALLAAASGLLILGSTLSVALTATGAVKYLFVAWFAGIAALGLFCTLPLSVIRRVELALLVGSAVPSLIMALGLYLPREPVASRQSSAPASAPSA